MVCRRGVVAGVFGLVLLVGVVGWAVPTVSPAASQPTATTTHESPAVLEDPGVDAPAPPGADNTVTRIVLRSNGSARWVVQIRTRLAAGEDESAFESFRDAFDPEQAADQFAENLSRTADAAESATGRSMEIEAVEAATSIQPTPRRWGVLTYTFRWEGFAAQTDGGIRIGDVFEGGFYLAANDTLVVETPAETDITTADPSPDRRGDETVTWTGEQVFVDGHPRVTAERATTTQSGPPILLGLLALLVVVGAAIVVRRRGLGSGDDDVPAGDDSQSTSGSSHEQPTATGENQTGRSQSTGGAAAAADAESSSTAGDPPTDQQGRVLSDRERVEQLLRQDGGQLHQSEIRDELDWSSSKTSRVLSKMVDAGTIRKVRIGRQNVIELQEKPADEEP